MKSPEEFSEILIKAANQYNETMQHSKGKIWIHPEDFELINENPFGLGDIETVCGIPICLTENIDRGSFIVTDNLIEDER